MKKNLKYLALIYLLIALVIGCDSVDDSSSDSSDSTSTVTLTGQVVSAESGDNLEGAIIKITDGSTVKGTTTDSDGEYSTTFEIESDIELYVIAYKAGYFQDTTEVFAITDSTIEVPLFKLTRDESSNDGTFTGTAASINLYSVSEESIGVKESGSTESAQIVFEVRDSSGAIIGDDNAITLNFRFGVTPGGGEYLYPSSATTNALGKASVYLNTGTVAGVVQVIAEAEVDGNVISSKPVLIAVHGGFPHKSNFHVGAEKLNYPFYGILGGKVNATAYVGDRYNNPVRTGTSVYFTTTSGIIQGSNTTGELGTASVSLLTEGDPVHSIYGTGYFEIYASSADEFSVMVKDTTLRLLSGFPYLTVSPMIFSIANGGSVTFEATLTDYNGNPLSAGQGFSVSTSGGEVKVDGQSDVKLVDALFGGSGITEFVFTVSDAKPDTVDLQDVTILVNTAGENGNVTVPIYGTSR